MTEEDNLYELELRNRALSDYERLDLAINELEQQTCETPRNNLAESSQVRMTLEEAISTFEEWIERDKKIEYADRLENIEIYKQVAEWLKKLQAYEEAREKIELKADKCPQPEIRYGMRYALYVQEKCLEEVNANENSD